MNDKTNTLASRNSELPEAMQQRQRRQAAAKNTQDWIAWIDQRLEQRIDQKLEGLHQAIGEIVAEGRLAQHKEIKEAVAEAIATSTLHIVRWLAELPTINRREHHE